MPDPLAVQPVPPASLAPATPTEVIESLAYALRHDERGKPRAAAGGLVATLAAERLLDHLRRSGFVVLKVNARPPHTAG